MTFRSALGRETWQAIGISLACGLVASCGGGGAATEPVCLDTAADATCTKALYGIHGGQLAPTFQDVFDNTLSRTCGVAGCHGGAHPQAGLKLDDIDAAYQGLLATDAAGERRVIPGDVKCGKVIVRLESVAEPWSMPPGGASAHLDEETLCAIRHWIKDGAKR